MTHLKFRNFLSAAVVALGLTVSGGIAVSAVTVSAIDGANQAPTAAEQTGESINGNHDDGQVGQAGDQQTGESVNDNKDQKDAGQAA
jgi:hypothetical protein